ncbi:MULTISPECIES: hypothetical protein [Halomonadaceae]|uniref:Uncharacterized protein n=1 Tax=Billgrantia aerodenitrificans TaxID=2733483 RepID=A0ABS9AL92_9GAMM|nr:MULTISPECIES: hypothetical protein [Halomonas]MCE8022519.1 hypothetical protein [Halomonas aerodenitrificans]
MKSFVPFRGAWERERRKAVDLSSATLGAWPRTMTVKKILLPVLLVLLVLGNLGGCDAPKAPEAGDSTARNIDRSMEGLKERLEKVGDDIEEETRKDLSPKRRARHEAGQVGIGTSGTTA